MEVVNYLDVDPSISMETIVAVSPLLGHELESRRTVRKQQDIGLGHEMALESARKLQTRNQKAYFYVAPLDILVERIDGQLKFHVIEINGTGIGGLTNLSTIELNSILNSFSDIPKYVPGPNPLILIASSGKEDEASPRMNKLIYEKVLYCESIVRGYDRRNQRCQILTTHHRDYVSKISHESPTVVLGYMKDFLSELTLGEDRRLRLGGHIVNGIINDRFCLNVLSNFKGQADLDQVFVCNQTYMAGADKGIAYRLYNKIFANYDDDHFPRSIKYDHAFNREQLIKTCLRRSSAGERYVIKPHGTGLGHGIQFFIEPHKETRTSITEKIDESLATIRKYYNLSDCGFPYTVCPFVDTETLSWPEKGFTNNKYELRVVAYRHRNEIRAFPSIAKVSPFAFDSHNISRDMLINNTTTASTLTQTAGHNYVLPLCNRDTWRVLGLDKTSVTSLCSGVSHYIATMIDEYYRDPQQFNLRQEARGKSRKLQLMR